MHYAFAARLILEAATLEYWQVLQFDETKHSSSQTAMLGPFVASDGKDCLAELLSPLLKASFRSSGSPHPAVITRAVQEVSQTMGRRRMPIVAAQYEPHTQVGLGLQTVIVVDPPPSGGEGGCGVTLRERCDRCPSRYQNITIQSSRRMSRIMLHR